MASSIKFSFFFFFLVLVHVLVLIPNPVLGDSGDEDALLQGINSYRQSRSLPALVKNGKADCLADQIAGDMEDQPCTSFSGGGSGSKTGPTPTTQVTQLAGYQKHLEKCKIEVGSTADGIVMPICVRNLVPTLVLTNYTQTAYTKYLNRTDFTGAGLGSEDDWMVVVLSTSTPTGSFSGAVSSGFGCFSVPLVFGLLISSLLVVISS